MTNGTVPLKHTEKFTGAKNGMSMFFAYFGEVEEVGMDGATIEAVCRAGPIPYMDVLVRQVNPRLSYRLTQFRSSAAESCREEIVLG